MASILKVDKIRGTGLDSDTISLDGSGNITIPKNVTFSGTQSGSFIKSSATNSLSGVASASVTGLSTTAKKLTVLVHDMSTSTGTPVRYRVRGNGADVTSVVYHFNSWYANNGGTLNTEGGEVDHLRFHSAWAGSANTYNVIINLYKVGSGLFYNFDGVFFNRGTGGSDYTAYNTRTTGRILATHLIDGFTAYTADGNNFDQGTMTVITEE